MNSKPNDVQLDPSSMAALPLVAVIGRPNVGKSTVFNRIVGHREAIVHDAPGVTRDRHYAEAWSLGHQYTIVDTGGFDPESDDPMRQGIARQVQVAIAEADVVVCVLDTEQGPTDADRQAVDLLRRSGKPTVFVANKSDSERAEHMSGDLYSLGVESLIPVSALHGRNFTALEEAIVERLPPATDEVDSTIDPSVIRVAIVGRPNAGKSSIVNRLAGEERSLVDDRPGTTRDPVDTIVEREGHRFLLVDTAGIRRRSSVTKNRDVVEIVSVLWAFRAMQRAEVVVLMCDARDGIAEQDAKILGAAMDRGRAIVIVMNKLDLLTGEERRKAQEDTRDKTHFAPWIPIVHTSATTGRGTTTLLQTVLKVRENFHKRVPTAELNRFFETVLETHPPPTKGGKAPRLYYVTQAENAPPRFVVMSNAPDAIHFSYQRYVVNQIRKHFGFEGVPIRVTYRKRRQKTDAPPTRKGSPKAR